MINRTTGTVSLLIGSHRSPPALTFLYHIQAFSSRSHCRIPVQLKIILSIQIFLVAILLSMPTC
ncbi:hypothetical protein P692DRAFT_201024343 [Suillus brevipes Sb2]|nr:hypothetical protein P692DRAFT_201024343 [Suillus brevipes Sb2]